MRDAVVSSRPASEGTVFIASTRARVKAALSTRSSHARARVGSQWSVENAREATRDMTAGETRVRAVVSGSPDAFVPESAARARAKECKTTMRSS